MSADRTLLNSNESSEPDFGRALELPADPIWHDALTRRLRSLLKTGPLHRLRIHGGRHDFLLPHDDTAALCMKALEVLVNALGIAPGARRTDVARQIAPLLEGGDRLHGVEPDRARHAKVVEVVIGTLLNDAGRRQAYEEAYLHFEGEEAVPRSIRFRLASEQETLDGEVVIRAEPDGVNLFLRSLDIELEDAQAATEAAMKSQLERGRLDLALHSAREARIRSVQYHDKIHALLKRTQRDIGRVDWRHEMPTLLEQAIAHLKARLNTERAVRETAQEHLERLAGRPEAELLRQICELLDDCYNRHNRLQKPLIGAFAVFREEQARQRFAPIPLQPLAEPEQDILIPTLRLSAADALPVADTFAHAATPPRAPVHLDLARLWEALLRPKREATRLGPAPDDEDLAPVAEMPRWFSDEARERVDARLVAVNGRVRLSHLLAELVADREAHLLVLRCLQHYAPEHQLLPIRVEVAAEPLEHGQFYGDDLWIAGEARPGLLAEGRSPLTEDEDAA